MRSLKFWVNEWKHADIMAQYWRKRGDAQAEGHKQTKFILLACEYNDRMAWAFMQIMRCFNV